MGFNKLFLPEIDSLKESLMKAGNEEFSSYWIRRYSKADAILGSEASLDFIKQFINMEYNEHNESAEKLIKK